MGKATAIPFNPPAIFLVKEMDFLLVALDDLWALDSGMDDQVSVHGRSPTSGSTNDQEVWEGHAQFIFDDLLDISCRISSGSFFAYSPSVDRVANVTRRILPTSVDVSISLIDFILLSYSHGSFLGEGGCFLIPAVFVLGQ